VLLAPLLLSGCGLGSSALSRHSAPETTGSIAAPVTVDGPLPQSLGYSDANRIGQAASAALWQAGGEPEETDWLNPGTGSSGTLIAAGSGAASAACRRFSTIVTSTGGVHRYLGEVCRETDGRAVLRIAD
jgi:surface antigen